MTRARLRNASPLFGALIAAAVAAAMLAPTAATAAAPTAHWVLISTSAPTYFRAGDEGDYFEVAAVNDGAAAAGANFTMRDALPPGVTATAIRGDSGTGTFFGERIMNCATQTVTCEGTAPVQPGETVQMRVIVAVSAGASGTLLNTATISGGGTQTARTTSTTPVSSQPVPFGAALATSLTGEDGSPATQAGSHPLAFTSILAFNVGSVSRFDQCKPEPSSYGCPVPSSEARDVNVALPPGLIGDPLAVPRCNQTTFQSYGGQNCPADTQVGVVQLYFYGNTTGSQQVPVYNVEPPPGEPGELGFTIASFFHIPMFFHVRSNGDYGLTAEVQGISEADPLQMSVLTVWGVPAAASHDRYRLGPREGSCGEGCPSDVAAKPFLTLPTSCTSRELEIPFSGDSWQLPASNLEELSPLPPAHLAGTTGCDALSFTPEALSVGPSIEVHPRTGQPDSPSGYTVSLQVPHNDTPEDLAAPELRNVEVTLPPGTSISPSAANNLQACSEAQFGLKSGVAGNCPTPSNVGEVEVVTPLLEKPLQGSLYLAQPKCGGGGQPACSEASATNGELYGLYLEVEGSGVIVKLKGTVSANPTTGQLTTTFKENPQLPFSELKVRLNGGAQAPLANPQTCGTFTTMSDLVPWSAPASADATPSSSFSLSGAGGSGCPSSLPFAPSFSAGTLIPNAASSSPFTLTFSRHDGEQDLAGVSVTLPPGLVGLLSQVPLCQEPQAAAGECPESSKIGTTAAAVGAGSNPYWINGGRVYLTGPYNGAPFGLSVVVPAQAGPFNLGNVVVRAAISVNPATAAVTVTSGPLPQIKDGVPFRLKTVNVTVDRPGFMLNPSNCEQQSITGTIAGAKGATASVSSPFAVLGCKEGLQFKPSMTASTRGKTSKAHGASLDVKVTYPSGREANIRSVRVSLPLALPSRLATLNKACTAAVFAANPALCPAESVVGIARAKSPVLPVTLTGPAYLVSHGGAAFPDLVVILQGDGVRVDLTGNTDIKKGITSSTFKSVPDVPVNSFELYLPQGRYSVFAANGNLCKQKLRMPTTLTGQNGAVIKHTTTIQVTGCQKANKTNSKKASRSRKATRTVAGKGRKA